MTEELRPKVDPVSPRGGLGLLLPDFGYGRCWRCRLPWWATSEHVVEYEPGRGQFALCERCWVRCTVQERISAHFWVTATVQRDIAKWRDVLAAIKASNLS